MVETFRHRFRVRYAECDVQGVVYNVHYLAYMDVVMVEMWRSVFGKPRSMETRDVDMMMIDSHIQYKASAQPDDEIEGEMWIDRIGRTSVVMKHRILLDDQVLALGTLAYVTVRLGSKEPIPVPDWMREALHPFTQGPRGGSGSPPPQRAAQA